MEGLIWLVIIIVAICVARSNKPYNEVGLKRQQELNKQMICPHCNTQGTVETKWVKRKEGISGGKATAGILTCGLSLFATGLSRKNRITEAHCTNCNATWNY